MGIKLAACGHGTDSSASRGHLGHGQSRGEEDLVACGAGLEAKGLFERTRRKKPTTCHCGEQSRKPGQPQGVWT